MTYDSLDSDTLEVESIDDVGTLLGGMQNAVDAHRIVVGGEWELEANGDTITVSRVEP